MHLAQNVHIAKTGEPLFSTPLYAYKNGAVIRPVVNNYSKLLNESSPENFPEEEKTFLKKIYKACYSADINELIALSHEDPEWKERPPVGNKSQQMDSMRHADEYKKQYGDFIKILDRMEA